MPPPIVLTPHQCDAVSYVAEKLANDEPVIALRGLAGTGKTSLIPTLIAVLEGTGTPVALGAPTHRAAVVLKKKGLAQADTVHSHALTPYFTGDYAKAMRWLGTPCPARAEQLEAAHPDVDGVPWLIAERLQVIPGVAAQIVRGRASAYDAKKAMESIGLSGRNHFAGFGPKCADGVLVIDEASMVGKEMLQLCLEAFPQVVLVGDPGQLPPVRDTQMLAEVPGFDLTEIHRQAADSAIIKLAYQARQGKKFFQSIPHIAGQVEEFVSLDPTVFLTSPLLVWRNIPRVNITKAIRAALGQPPASPTVGEPLQCRATHPRDRAEGFVNNALFRVVAVDPGNPSLLTVQQDDGQENPTQHDVLVHMEETDGDNIDPEAVVFRYAYCLTAHTAQGGEWPTVYVSIPELYAHSRRPTKDGEPDDFPKWAYTAITRAKTTLGFLRKHDFTLTAPVASRQWVAPAMQGDVMPRMSQTSKDTIAPPSAPMLTLEPEPDDLDDPEVPGAVLAVMGDDPMAPAVPGIATQAPTTSAVVPTNGQTRYAMPAGLEPSHDALLRGFTQYMHTAVGELIRDESIRITKSADHAMQSMHDYVKGVLQSLAYGAKEPAGVPYEMALRVRTPGGIPLTLTIRKQTPADLLDELTRLEGWLAANGYTGVAA